MAKLVDALLSGGSARNGVAVRLCSCAHDRMDLSFQFHPVFLFLRFSGGQVLRLEAVFV